MRTGIVDLALLGVVGYAGYKVYQMFESGEWEWPPWGDGDGGNGGNGNGDGVEPSQFWLSEIVLYNDKGYGEWITEIEIGDKVWSEFSYTHVGKADRVWIGFGLGQKPASAEYIPGEGWFGQYIDVPQDSEATERQIAVEGYVPDIDYYHVPWYGTPKYFECIRVVSPASPTEGGYIVEHNDGQFYVNWQW